MTEIENLGSSDALSIEHYVTWDSDFDITFFDENFQKKNSENNFFLGTQLFFEIAWKEDFSKNYPLEFYTESCVISDAVSQMSFNIIKKGCEAEIINVQHRVEIVYFLKFLKKIEKI